MAAHMPHLPPDLPGIRGPMAFRPETAKPLNELVDVLLRGPHTLSPGERELIATYVSSQNDCRVLPDDPRRDRRASPEATNRWSSTSRPNYQSAPPSRDKLKALLVIAGKTAKGGKNVTAADVARAREQGATRPRDSRHGAHRRRVLHVQPLRGRPRDVDARRSRFLPPARRARRRKRLRRLDAGQPGRSGQRRSDRHDGAEVSSAQSWCAF